MDLVGDIGGTHTRLCLAAGGALIEESWKRYTNAEFHSAEALIGAYLQDAPLVSHLCLAAAGPVVGHSLALTNHPWVLERMRLTALTEGAQVTLVNDMQGQGHGLQAVAPDALRHLAGPRAGVENRALVVNIGTGLNAAVVHRVDGRTFVPPSEAGHIYLDGAVLAEDRASGRALTSGVSEHDLTKALARFVHDLAHVHLPTNGIFLTGGVAQVLAGRLDWAGLHMAMQGQGPYRDLLARLPIHLVTDDRITLRGAARIAAREAA